MNFPVKYKWMEEMPTPKMWAVAKKHYGVIERGKNGLINTILINWWRLLGVFGRFKNNDFPWCGGFVAIVVKEAGYKPVKDFLGARNWLNYGIQVERAKWMDIVVFTRPGGNHVAFVVAQNKENYLCYGGNQSDKVGLAWIAKSRCIGIRRTPYVSYVPPSLKTLTFDGQLSTNES